MSKAKLIITAVVVEGRSQAEVARSYGVSKGWVSKLVARYRQQGEGAFEPRSRRPKTSPTAIDAATVELILRLRKDLSGQGLDAGPDTIAWQLLCPVVAALRLAPPSTAVLAGGADAITTQSSKSPGQAGDGLMGGARPEGLEPPTVGLEARSVACWSW
ncbi:helix-turn-helix domain-containing protein [Microbispora bryophytorum]|uniref:helix-turn-helix domain-containing protein n=1 Tax=Microbispora bryophytorum TaxID=1460882 RepID=UPI00340817C8